MSVKTDAEGKFLLERLTPGSEYLRVSHPDYALLVTKEMTLVGGENRLEPFVLHRGGTVRGRVFDDKGKPLPGVELSIRDVSGWNETTIERLRGEFAVVTTDAEGRYEVKHVPASLVYVIRSDPWTPQGVVRDAILPTEGGEATLDLGGETAVRGRMLVGGKPLANTRIQLTDNNPHFGKFKAYAMTDAEGRFVFWSPAAGVRAMYFAAPGQQNEWVPAANVTMGPTPADLGDVAVPQTSVAVTVTGLAAEDVAGASVSLAKYDENWPGGESVGLMAPRAEGSAPYVFEYVPAGEYEAVCARPDYVTLRQRVTVPDILPGDGGAVEVKLAWPLGTASITGRMPEGVCGPGGCNLPNLWSKDGRIASGLYVREGDRFEVKGLPAGDYILSSADTRNPPPAMEFSLALAETKQLNLSDGSYKAPTYKDGYLEVICYTDGGVPLPGCEVTLTGEGGALAPNSSQEGRVMFVGPLGTYRMTVKFPGMEPMEGEATLVPTGEDGRAVEGYSIDVRLRAGR